MHLVKIITVLLFTVNSWALSSQDKAQLSHKNLMDNGGFENGLGRWAASAGTFAAVTSGSNLLIGRNSATWDAAALNDTLSYNAITIPKGYYNTNALAECKLQTPSGTATHTLEVYDGSAVVAEVVVTSSTTPVIARVNFIMPSSGTITLRFEAQANEPLIAIDDCYIGDAANLTEVSQASVFGTAKSLGTSACTWSTTSTSFASYAADSDCATITTTGSLSAPATKIPGFKVASLPPGGYRVVAIGDFSMSSTAVGGYRFHDGTTAGQPQVMNNQSSAVNVSSIGQVEGYFEYTTAQTNVTFEIQGFLSAGTANYVLNAIPTTADLNFIIYRYPTSSELAFKADQTNRPWTAYTPTFTGFGTAANIDAKWKRQGEDMLLRV
ncbi:MAG: hypothetical protein ACXABY_17960, partial [Candidatus Thorarchaeota archaeon]